MCFYRSGDTVQPLEDTPRAIREAPVDDVDVPDGAPAEHESESDVPVSLFAAAKNGHGVDLVAFYDETGGGERGAEGG